MYNGIVNVYKEKGYTSHDVVAKMRGIYSQKKIGHTGTLDPDAEGVLPVCLGKATKVCDLLTDRNKTYEAEILLGVATDTQDTSGEILSKSSDIPDEESVLSAIMSFIGDYDQVPPMYSALKVNGKKLYELAREGKVIERKPRRVHIFGIEIISVNLPRVRMTVTCSKGTYIRTLCDDIGAKLGCGGCMSELKRTQVGEFEVGKSIRLAELEALKDTGRLEETLTAVDELFTEYPEYAFKEQEKKAADNGNRLRADAFTKNTCGEVLIRVYDTKHNFYGLYQYDKDRNDYKPLKIFKA